MKNAQSSAWETEFLSSLAEAGIAVEQETHPYVLLWRIRSGHWHRFAEFAAQMNCRWVAGWAEAARFSPGHAPEEETAGNAFAVNACFEHQRTYLLIRTFIEEKEPNLPSQASIFAAASRSERHTQDMFGIHFTGHADNRPWIRHKAWPKHHYPLRKDFPVQGEPQEVTPPDLDYQFVKAYGAGVYEIPVGPVHAGIIEPGHFRFQAVGELILNLEERLGYVHKGIEKIAEGRTPDSLARLAGRVSGDTTVGHSWAACMAMEQAAEIQIPPKAALIRGILAERERVANHLGDIGAICNDVAFVFGQMQLTRLRELWLRSNAALFGHRLLMDKIIPGGVAVDIADEASQRMLKEIAELRVDFAEVVEALDSNTSLEDRLYTAGYLSSEIAAAYGTLGYVGRASGQNFDVRRHAPYPPYDQAKFKVPLETQGDIASRVWIRIKEINASLKLIEQFVNRLNEAVGLLNAWRVPLSGSEGLGIVEGWRGEIVAHIRFEGDNKIARYYPRDPSLLNWPALEKLVLNNIVPDFPVCNKSLNGSYSGNDL